MELVEDPVVERLPWEFCVLLYCCCCACSILVESSIIDSAVALLLLVPLLLRWLCPVPLTLFPVKPRVTSVFGVFPCIDPDPPDVVLVFRLAPYAATAAVTLSLLPNKCSFPAELIDGWSTLKIETVMVKIETVTGVSDLVILIHWRYGCNVTYLIHWTTFRIHWHHLKVILV